MSGAEIMTFNELLAELGTRKLQLGGNGDELLVYGDTEALHPLLIGQLQAHKPSLLQLVSTAYDGIYSPAVITPDLLPLVTVNQQEIDDIVAQVPGGAGNVQDVYPLAPLQEGILFHHLLSRSGDTYLLPCLIAFDIRNRLDDFLQALQCVIDRHDILRTAIVWEGVREPVQVVWRRARLAIKTIDLPEGDAAAQMRERFDGRHYRLDLRHAPLLQAIVARDETQNRWMLMLLFHHLAVDHAALEILFEEIHAHLTGKHDQLPPPLPFRNFVAQARLGVSAARHEAFFREMLQGIDGPTAPFGLLDTQGDGREVSEARVAVEEALCRRLRRQARVRGVSAASIFHLAFAQVLAKSTGREDVVFGTVLFGRMQGGDETSRVLGTFINTLPLRVRLGEMSVNQSLQATHRQLIGLLRHEHASLALAQRCSAVPAGMPLFSALLNYRYSQKQDEHSLARAFEGMEVLGLEERTNYPFMLSVDDLGMEFVLTAQVLESIGARRICQFMHKALEHLVEALEQSTEIPQCTVEVLPEAERALVLNAFNETVRDFPQQALIHELFEAQVRAHPQATALQYEDERLTYSELNARANQLAHYLIALGVTPDDRVAIGLERSVAMVIAVLATLKAGGAYVPIDPAYPRDRLAYMLVDASPKRVLTQTSLQGVLPATATPTVMLDTQWPEIAAHPVTNPERRTQTPRQLAYVIYTSGSTGRPKGVMVEHGNVVNFMESMRHAPGIGPDDVLLSVTSLSFDIAGLELFLPLLNGARVVLASREQAANAEQLQALIERWQVSIMQATPSTWSMLAEQSRPNSLRTLKALCGGEALPVSLAQRLLSYVPEIWNLYGPTETTIWSTLRRVTEPRVDIGRPIANTRIYILDERLQPVPVGVSGELYIGGCGVTRGYLNQPQLTAQRFIEDPFVAGSRLYKTGDLGRWLPDGNIEYLGRNDFQVKIRGHRIELGEIETHLRRLEGVREGVVLAREEDPGEPRLVAYYTGKPLSAKTLRAHATKGLPQYMVPAAFVHLDELPLTPNGKVDRKKLPAPEQESYASRTYEAPQGMIEHVLARLWSQLMKVERVGRHDNFFELGGHSLLAVSLIEHMRRQGLRLELRHLFSHPVLLDLAQEVAALHAEGADELVVPENGIPAGCTHITPEMLPLVQLAPKAIEQIVAWVPGGVANVQDVYPLAPLQEGILFHHLLQQQGDAYLNPTLLCFDSWERLERFAETLNQVIARHDILRTAVLWEGLKDPVQVVWRQARLVVERLTFADEAGDIETQLRAYADPSQYRLDIRRAPLMRGFAVFDSRRQRWLMQLLHHHLVTDYTTLKLLIAEVALLQQGREAELPPAVPFRNFVAHARLGISVAEQEAFFRKMLEGIGEPTAPFGLLNVHGNGSGIAEAQQPLEDSLAQRVRSVAPRFGVSTAALFHAAWAAVVARTSGREDVVFGTVLQGTAGADRPLGMLINTLPLRLRLKTASARQAVEQSHRELGRLLEYEQASLALAQRCSGISGGAPLFTAVLNYRRSDANPVQFSQQFGIQVLTAQERTNYPITVSVDDLPKGFTITAQTERRLDPSRVTQYLQTSLQSLVDALEHEPERSVLTLEILSERELSERRTANATHAEQFDCCLHSRFVENARRDPQRIALEYSGGQMTYGELLQRSCSLAQQLRSRGACRNQLIGVVLERGWEQVVAVLGILLSGAAYLPIDPRWPAQRRAYLLEQGEARIVVTQKKLNEEFEWAADIQRVCVSQEDEFAQASVVLPSGQSIDDLAYVIFTSGSTGTPKGVMIDHKGAVNTVLHINRLYGVSEQDKVLAVSELTFDLSVYDLFGLLGAGGTVVIPDVSLARDPEHWQALVRQHGVTVWNSVPQLMSMLVDMVELSGSQPLSSVRLVMMSGDWIPVRLPDRIKAISPDVGVIGMGGATEGSIWSIYYRIAEVPPQWESIPYGKALPNQHMYVLDGQLQPCADWITGDIYIGGVGVALGYWKNAAQTQAQFMIHPHSGERIYKTGDLGRVMPGGDIEFLGRIDQQVKVRGFRIELGEIEAQLRRHPQVREVVVIVREDAPSEKRLVAYYTAEEGEAPSLEQLRAHLQQSLPEYMVPSAYVALGVLPLTSNGKVDKKALPRPELGAGTAERYQAPQGKSETLLAQIWQELLSVERVGRHDNFFELGGHSLVAIQVLKRVQQSVAAKITLRDILRFPTIAELGAAVDGPDESVQLAKNPTRLRDGRSHPLFFVHTVYGDPDHYSALANLLTIDRPVYGLHVLGRERESLQMSLRELASSHIVALLDVEPQGPYYLAGHSSGGLLAYEMAKQLIDAGKKVDFVGLIDVHDLSASEASDDQPTDPISDLLTILRVIIGEHTGIVDGPSLHEIVPVHTPDPRAAFDNLIRSGLIPEHVGFDDVVRRASSMAALRKMAYDYVPAPLAANVHLFAAAESIRKAPLLRWKPAVAADWPIHVVNGDHTSIVAPPNIRILANVFSSQLRDACADPSKSRSYAESIA